MTTHHLQPISNELHRITSYTAIMAQLAQDGTHSTIEVIQLQQIFADIAKVTGVAFAEIEAMIINEAILQA